VKRVHIIYWNIIKAARHYHIWGKGRDVKYNLLIRISSVYSNKVSLTIHIGRYHIISTQHIVFTDKKLKCNSFFPIGTYNGWKIRNAKLIGSFY